MTPEEIIEVYDYLREAGMPECLECQDGMIFVEEAEDDWNWLKPEHAADIVLGRALEWLKGYGAFRTAPKGDGWVFIIYRRDGSSGGYGEGQVLLEALLAAVKQWKGD